MDSITIRVFCSQISSVAPQPNQGFNTVVLSGVRVTPGAAPGAPGPNDALFDRASDGTIQLNLSNVSDKTATIFAKGKSYKVTIEEDSA